MKNQKKLIIVESPSKTKAIAGYVGDEYLVLASKGHIRDLPEEYRRGAALAVDVKNGYEPHYQISKDKVKVVEELQEEAAKASKVYLATDPDREGEAIAWHLATVLNLDIADTDRLEFREITRDGILSALEQPSRIDMKLVESQQARRILDRLIGFELSDLVKKKTIATSAGRVQSATLKLIVDHEREILAFVPQDKWSLKLDLVKDGRIFTANFEDYNNEKYKIESEVDGQKIIALLGKTLKVIDVQKRTRKKDSPSPFITSTLQQDAFTRLGFSSAKTASVAQKLYDGSVEIKGVNTGLITYMRTDSTRLSESFIAKAFNFIENEYGVKYVGAVKKPKKVSVLSQDAHEAIRPTDIRLTPELIKDCLSSDEYRLYKLIYNRAIGFLMSSKIEEVTTARFESNKAIFKSDGVRVVFDGFTRVYGDIEPKDNNDNPEELQKVTALPEIVIDEDITIHEIKNEMYTTKPPARYSEGRVVALMEKEGIGRPSTYATTITRLKDHQYVSVEKGILTPTIQGFSVVQMLEDYFPSIVEAVFTANMENKLDAVADGNETRIGILDNFYPPFHEKIIDFASKIDASKYRHYDGACPECGGQLEYRVNSATKEAFVACMNFPKCRYTLNLKPKNVPVGRQCPECGGELIKINFKGSDFIGCSNYPTCKYTEAGEKKRYRRSKFRKTK